MRNTRFFLAILFLGSLTISLTACGGSKGSGSTAVTLVSLSVAPANLILSVAANQQFTANGTYSNGTSHDTTTQVAWSSSNPSVATVSSTGLVTAVNAGIATITATSGGISGSAPLTVTSATLSSISIIPANPSLPVGVARQFIANGIYSDGTSHDITIQVTWSSSNPSVATVSSTGLVTAVNAGTATITATSGGVSGSTLLTVTSATLSSIAITPANPSLPVGIIKQFAAIGTYSDGTGHDITTQVTWSSSNASVATVSSGGLAVISTAGTATITATGGGKSGSTALTVTPATLSSLSVTPSNPSVPVGAALHFIANGGYSDGTGQDITTQISWSSSNTPVVTINAGGLATPVAAGTATITATGGGKSGSATLTVTPATLSSLSVTPANPSLPAGVPLQFLSSGIYSDGTSRDITTQVTWSSSNTSAVTVDARGLAIAFAAGTAAITAAVGSIAGSTTLTVTPATLSSLSVTPANPSPPAGVPQQFLCSGIYSDGTSRDITTQVTWSSSNTSVVTVDGSGLATPVAAGTAAINAIAGSISGSTALTVTAAVLSSISVAPANPTIHVGVSKQFTALGIYSDGTIEDITRQVIWSVSNGAVAFVSSNGLVIPIAAGTATITATAGSISGSTTLTVR